MAGKRANVHQEVVLQAKVDLRRKRGALSAPLNPRNQSNSVIEPIAVQSFIGIFDTGRQPPDATAAASRNYLVSAVNGRVGIFDSLSGVSIIEINSSDFWNNLGTQKGQPAFNVHSPKVLYDTFSGRFVMVSLGGDKTSANPGSWILLGISAPNNPIVWTQWAIKAAPNSLTHADYPGVGLDRNHVYVTANMLQGQSFQHVKVWVFGKAQLINRNRFIKYFSFVNPPGSRFTTQPTQVYGTSPNGQYLITVLNGHALRLFRITFAKGVPSWHQVRNVTVSRFPFPNVPNVPQRATDSLVKTNDTRLLNAVYRNGSIYTVHHVASHDRKRTEVAWYQISPTKSTPIQQGRIRSNTLSYYYPSISVNVNRAVVVGFSGSSPEQYISAYFTGRGAEDRLGTMKPATLLKEGVFPILGPKSGTPWGAYSATFVDFDGTSFWTFQEYAERQSLWGTWFGKIRILSFPTTGRFAGANPLPKVKRKRPWMNPKMRLGPNRVR